jgi:hypothetical protein
VDQQQEHWSPAFSREEKYMNARKYISTSVTRSRRSAFSSPRRCPRRRRAHGAAAARASAPHFLSSPMASCRLPAVAIVTVSLAEHRSASCRRRRGTLAKICCASTRCRPSRRRSAGMPGARASPMSGPVQVRRRGGVVARWCVACHPSTAVASWSGR